MYTIRFTKNYKIGANGDWTRKQFTVYGENGKAATFIELLEAELYAMDRMNGSKRTPDEEMYIHFATIYCGRQPVCRVERE